MCLSCRIFPHRPGAQPELDVVLTIEGVSIFSPHVIDKESEILVDSRDDLIEIEVDCGRSSKSGRRKRPESVPTAEFFRNWRLVVLHDMLPSPDFFYNDTRDGKRQKLLFRAPLYLAEKNRYDWFNKQVNE
jgi:hypothetical protein